MDKCLARCKIYNTGAENTVQIINIIQYYYITQYSVLNSTWHVNFAQYAAVRYNVQYRLQWQMWIIKMAAACFFASNNNLFILKLEICEKQN